MILLFLMLSRDELHPQSLSGMESSHQEAKFAYCFLCI